MDALTVFNDLSQTLGQFSEQLPTEARARILAEINATSQILAAAPVDFFTRQEVTETTSIAVPSITLDTDILNISEPVRHSDGEVLTPIATRGQFDNYGALYGGQSDRSVTAGKPSAYFIDGKRSAAAESGSDFSQVKLYLWPTPDAGYPLTLDCRKTPPAITRADLAGTQQIIEITSLGSALDDDTYIFLRGYRGTLALWFNSAVSEPSEPTGAPVAWRAATERVYVSTDTWSDASSGGALVLAAISPYYPESYILGDSDEEIRVHLGCSPFDASTTYDASLESTTEFTPVQAGVAPTAIPAPHGMVEAIFLPIARFRLATFYRHFTDDQKLTYYQAQAAAAYALVGLDPGLMRSGLDPQGSTIKGGSASTANA